MADERPTVPPPRRRSEDRLPAQRQPPSTPVPPSSDPRELVLRELRDVEQRAKDTTQRAIAEVCGVFERQLAERDEEIVGLRETIRQLQSADTAAVVQYAELSASIAATVTLEVKRQLNAQAAAEGAEAGATAGKAAGSRAGAKWTPIAGFLGAVIAAAVSTGAQKCSAEDKSPAPAAQQPAPGPGYGGRR